MFLCRALEWQFSESMLLCGGEKYDTPGSCVLRCLVNWRGQEESSQGELWRKGLLTQENQPAGRINLQRLDRFINPNNFGPLFKVLPKIEKNSLNLSHYCLVEPSSTLVPYFLKNNSSARPLARQIQLEVWDTSSQREFGRSRIKPQHTGGDPWKREIWGLGKDFSSWKGEFEGSLSGFGEEGNCPQQWR